MGREKEALRTLDTLVARHPDYPSARYFLGEALGRAGRLPEAHYHLGLYHWAQRDVKNARFHLERALDGIQNEMRREKIEEILDQLGKSKPQTGSETGEQRPRRTGFVSSDLRAGRSPSGFSLPGSLSRRLGH
jgi:predicted Zn-dependent protease